MRYSFRLSSFHQLLSFPKIYNTIILAHLSILSSFLTLSHSLISQTSNLYSLKTLSICLYSYFFEVPSRLLCETGTAQDGDDLEFVDCHETFDIDLTESDHDESNAKDQTLSGANSASLKLKRLPGLNLNNPLTMIFTPESAKDSRKPSTNLLLTKLRQTNELVAQKLTKPLTSSVGLTKLISFRKHHHHHYSSEESENRARMGVQRSISDELETINQGEMRRRNKSQSASIDDALSIIEERVDDDNLSSGNRLSIGSNRPRARLLSSSSTKSRPGMIRSKEIDLTSEDGEIPAGRSHITSLSSTDADDENANSSASTLEPDRTLGRSESLLSSSSQSASILTDDTIRPQDCDRLIKGVDEIQGTTGNEVEMKSGAEIVSESSKDSTRTIGGDRPVNRLARSESAFSSQGPKQQMQPLAGTSNSIDIASAKQTSPDFNRQPDGSSSNNFAQSVRTVKLQQQLLQNMIRNQNQGLLSHSASRARNAFMYPNRVHQSEYPFVTLKRFPGNMIKCTGGVVSVHSVKLLDHIINDEESETRDIWWTEIRKEIRSHAKALNCNTILGYSETSKVLGDVCILSASGTAAILRPTDLRDTITDGVGYDDAHSQPRPQLHTLKVPRLSPSPKNSSMYGNQEQLANESSCNSPIGPEQATSETPKPTRTNDIDCSFCHTPLVCAQSIHSSASNQLPDCTICKSSKVPDVLLMTIEPPNNLNIVSPGCLVQARVCRAKRDSHGEANAKEIGDALPFLEYELHRQLFGKLKFKGMNCLFNLCVDISVGENMLTGIATGTGCYVLGLPTPEPPLISAGKGIKASKLNEIQRLIAQTAMKNRERLGLEKIFSQLEEYHKLRAQNNVITPEQRPDEELTEQSQLQQPAASSGQDHELSDASSRRQISSRHHGHHHHHRSKRSHYSGLSLAPAENLSNLLNDSGSIVLEVDDNEDADIIALLIDSDIPDGYTVCNSETIPSIHPSSINSINMFTQVMRAKLSGMDQFAQQLDWLLQLLFVKLRRSLPCCLTNISFVVDLPEAHIVQISVTGCLLGLRPPPTGDAGTGAETSDQPRPTPPSSSSGSPGSSSSAGTSNSSSPSSSSPPAAPTTTTTSSDPSVESVRENTSLTKSLGRQLSKSNLVAMLSARGSSAADKRKSKEEDIELLEQSQPVSSEGQATTPSVSTKDTIAAVKLEIEQNRLGQSTQVTPLVTPKQHTMRAVFKKQQTYPGANSPAISGQDRLLLDSGPSTSTGITSGSGGGGSAAARRAAIILNKMKQPLKELGSNFNSNPPATDAPSSVTWHSGQQTSRAKSGSSIIGAKNARSPASSVLPASAPGGSGGPALCGMPPIPPLEPRTIIVAKSMSKTTGEGLMNSSIDITSLSNIPGAKDYHYLGNLSFSFVRETNSVRENGGLNGFIHCFLMEVYAIVRAHVSALGGNAFLSFRLQQSCIFYHSNKNQAQCLISVAGDAVQVAL